jgi:hypothetical protein
MVVDSGHSAFIKICGTEIEATEIVYKPDTPELVVVVSVLDQAKLKEAEYVLDAKINARNSHGAKSPKLPVKLTLGNSGVLVFPTEETNLLDEMATHGFLNVSYTEETSISLSSLFEGQDM